MPPQLHAGLRSRQISSDFGSDSDSGLKLSTQTPTPTPLLLRPNRMYSILRREKWCSYFLDFTFRTDASEPALYPNGRYTNIFSIRANCGCRRSWLLLIPLNVVGMSVFECISTVTDGRGGPKISSDTSIKGNTIIELRSGFI